MLCIEVSLECGVYQAPNDPFCQFLSPGGQEPRWYSCRDFTVRPLDLIERMAQMLASTPLMVVRIGMRRSTAVLRILTSSFLGVLPLGVLMIRSISSFLIMSMICGRPSLNLKSRLTIKPAEASAAAVPLVA